MQLTSPLLISIFIHLGVALGAEQASKYFRTMKPKEPTPVYSVDFIEIEKPKLPVAPPKMRKQKRTPVKAKQSRTTRKAPARLTQKQKSPVQIPVAVPSPIETKQPDLTTVDSNSPVNPKDARNMRQKMGNKPPGYPMADRIRRKTGRVMVLGYVDDAGQVSQVRVTDTTGSDRMNRNAINAFASYLFEEGQEGWVEMPFEYALDGQAKTMSVRDRHLINQ